MDILEGLRSAWTDKVVAGWAASGQYKMEFAEGVCKDCGHPVVYKKGHGDVLCSACMIINAKFPFGSEGKTTQLVNGKGIGGIGLLVLPDREEMHLWLNQPLQTHVAVLEMPYTGARITVHPTNNKGNVDLQAFIRDLVLWPFASGDVYWAGVCQENDSHKVSHLLQSVTPSIWNGMLSVRKSLSSTIYVQPDTLAVLRSLVSHIYWDDFARDAITHVRILGDAESYEENLLSQIDGAANTQEKCTLTTVLEKEQERLAKLLQSRSEKSVELTDHTWKSLAEYLNEALGVTHDTVLQSVHENLLFVWS